jgi:hypothetical protein
MRVLAWVLNGLDLVAQNAVLSTSADGVARNTFWLSTRAGAKLSDAGAERAAERVNEYVAHCSPVRRGGGFRAAGVLISPGVDVRYSCSNAAPLWL